MPSKKQRAVIYYGFIGLSACFVLAMIYGLVFLYALSKCVEPEQAVHYRLSADTLYAAYQENEIAANMRYMGKTVIVSGVIANIGENIFGNSYLVFSVKDRLSGGVQCYFQKEFKSRLAGLYKDQRIKVKGRVDSYTIKYVGLKDCVIQD